jgi:DNA modification methylase
MEILDSIETNIQPNSATIIKKDSTFHALVTADSLKLMPSLPSESINLIVTDPPYNVGLNYGPFYNDRKKKEEFFSACHLWLEQCTRLLKKTGSFYLISYPEINARLLPFIEDKQNLILRRWITWHYPTNIGHSKRNFTRSQRSILFLTKSNNYVFNRQKIIQHYKNPEVSKIKERIKMGSKGRTSYDLLRYLDVIELSKGMADVLDINLLKNVSKDRFNKKHPCQLPLGLLRILIAVSSNKRDILLDPFAGTFTLSAAAASLGRNSIGIEVNPDYVQLGLERLRK